MQLIPLRRHCLRRGARQRPALPPPHPPPTHLQALLGVLDAGRKAALVAHVRRVLAVLGLDDALEHVEDLGAVAQRLGERRRADGRDLAKGGTGSEASGGLRYNCPPHHELLHGQRVAGVLASVDDVL